MRTLIDYIRSCFCKHDWVLLSHEEAEVPEYSFSLKWNRWIHRCKKCGYTKMYRTY